MEIKLKSCFIEIRDNQKLKLFSSKRNKLDENNLYNKFKFSRPNNEGKNPARFVKNRCKTRNN